MERKTAMDTIEERRQEKLRWMRDCCKQVIDVANEVQRKGIAEIKLAVDGIGIKAAKLILSKIAAINVSITNILIFFLSFKSNKLIISFKILNIILPFYNS